MSRLTPQVVQLLRNALAACERKQFAQGIRLLEQAAKLAPHESRIQLDLARCHGARYDYGAAELCLEKAVRMSGWQASSLGAAGDLAFELQQYPVARRYFERLLKEDAHSVMALLRLARIKEHTHHLDAAADYAERVLRLNNRHAEALLIRARVHGRQGQTEEAEKLLRSITANPMGAEWTRYQAWLELGKILDRQSRFDEAMSAFLAGKALLRPHAGPDLARAKISQQNVARAARELSTDVLKKWRQPGPAIEPTRRFSMLCGHPRSGTTLLEQVLESHPEIVSAEETHIFHDEAFDPLFQASRSDQIQEVLDAVPDSQLNQARKNYFASTERFLQEPLGDRLLLDKNPAMTSFIPAVVRVIPEARFLVALRDPRDVCLSCFMQVLPLNPNSVTYLTLEDTIAKYASVMSFWLAIKPKLANPWLEIRYEDMVEDLESAARRTLEFLEVPWAAGVLSFHEHARNKVVRSPTYADVQKPIYRGAMNRWRNYQKHLEPLLPALEPFVQAFGYE